MKIADTTMWCVPLSTDFTRTNHDYDKRAARNRSGGCCATRLGTGRKGPMLENDVVSTLQVLQQVRR